MLLPPLLRSLEARRLPSRARRRQPWRRRRPLLEGLEDRTLLSTFTVNSTLDDGSVGTLRWAVGQANSTTGADTIDFDSTVFNTPKTIALTAGQLTLTDTTGATTITGPSVGVTIARSTAAGTPDFSIMGVNSGVSATLENLTITGGNAGSKGSGGAIFNSGTLTLTNSTLSGNSAARDGGGIYNNGMATLTNSTLSGNSASYGGGIDNSYGGRTTLTNSTLSGNSAGGDGGGIFNSFGGTSTQINTTLTLINTTLSGNSAGGDGGGVFNSGFGRTTLTNSTLSGNSARYGGGIDNGGTATLTNSTLSGNSARYGGGIDNDGTLLTLTNSTLSGNSARYAGGGIDNVGGTATLTNSTLSGNSADGGGGIYNNGTATLTNSTLSGNSARYGGGIDNVSSDTARLNNTIVGGNTLSDHVTPSDLAGNVPVDAASAHNLIGPGGSGGLSNGVNGNIVVASVADLHLGPLANNGGPTQTMALLARSPAINAGDNTLAVDPTTHLPLATDQRGVPFARIFGGTVDIGAYEAQTLHLVVDTTADENNGNYGPGDLSLRQAIALANANPGADTIGFDIPGAGVHTISLLSALAARSPIRSPSTGPPSRATPGCP